MARKNSILKVIPVLFALLLISGCGGSTKQAFIPAPTPTPTPVAASASPTPFPTPIPVTDNITLNAADVMNMGMIGQTWTFQNGNGDINTFTIESVPDGVACRGGNNLAIHMTKTTANAYWGLGVDHAEVWSILHFNADGSGRFISNLINFPLGCPWCGNAPLIITGEIIDNTPDMPLPYLISPPDTSTADHVINETRVSALNVQGLTYNCAIPADQPLADSKGGEYWRTDFYLAEVQTPAYSGPAIVSDQFEDVCGHERWYFAPGMGIVQIDSLNDGGAIKNNPVCNQFFQHNFSSTKYTIKRIS